ncbi:hypothetical protein PG984_015012 [Apiospora sp. TS-2023a]
MSDSGESSVTLSQHRATLHGRIFQEGEACVGLDFGHSSSKLALAYLKHGESVPRLRRVHIPPDEDYAHDPERKLQAYQLVSYAGWDGDAKEWVIGWAALQCDHRVPLKAMLLYVAGLLRKYVVEKMPGGKALLGYVAKGMLNDTTIRALLEDHVTSLYQFANTCAELCEVKIKSVVVTYPNYLSDEDTHACVTQYTDALLGIVRPIWGEHPLYQTASEGQATAVYVVTRFDDNDSAKKQKHRLRNLFQDLDTSQTLNLLVADNGGSTTNFQSLNIKVDETGYITQSQSNIPHGISTGSKGGSNTANELVDLQIREKLKKHIREQNLLLGELAGIPKKFERCKKMYNYQSVVPPLSINCKVDNRRKDAVEVIIGGDQIKKAMKAAFSPGINLIKKEVKRVTELGKDFAVLFCGGSYVNKGLWAETNEMMKKIREEVAKQGNNVQWAFLRTEEHWSSAVASGAALSMMNLPAPEDLLMDSAIGLQEVFYHNGKWVGANEAEILYFDHNRPSLSVDLDSSDLRLRSKMNFYLVCDPFYRKLVQEQGHGTDLPAIQIQESEVYGQFGTYDLGCLFKSADLPRGKLRFRMSLVSTGDNTNQKEDGWEMKPLSFLLTIQLIDDRSGARINHKQDRKWLVRLATDPRPSCCKCTEASRLCPSGVQSAAASWM